MDFTNPLFYGGPAFVIFILLELTYSKNHKDHHDLYEWKDLFASGFMGVGSAVLAALLKTVSAIVIFELLMRIFLGNKSILLTKMPLQKNSMNFFPIHVRDSEKLFCDLPGEV